MQYFVYEITSPTPVVKKLKKLDSFDKYKDAKKFAKSQREQITDEHITIKIIYSENELTAEETLQEKREPPILEEWEK